MKLIQFVAVTLFALLASGCFEDERNAEFKSVYGFSYPAKEAEISDLRPKVIARLCELRADVSKAAAEADSAHATRRSFGGEHAKTPAEVQAFIALEASIDTLDEKYTTLNEKYERAKDLAFEFNVSKEIAALDYHYGN